VGEKAGKWGGGWGEKGGRGGGERGERLSGSGYAGGSLSGVDVQFAGAASTSRSIRYEISGGRLRDRRRPAGCLHTPFHVEAIAAWV